MKTRTRGWCFILNNWTDDHLAELMAIYMEYDSIAYLIVGFESAPKTGTKHIQGYIYFTDPKGFNSVRTYLPEGSHIEDQKAKLNVNAYCYCMEDGDYYEMGNRPRQGHRTDLEVIKHDLLNNVPMTQISKQYFSQWCQYRRAFDEFSSMHLKQDTEMVQYDDTSAQSYKFLQEEYIPGKDFMVSGVMFPGEIMGHYMSKKYRRIYVPLVSSADFMMHFITRVI